MGFSVSGSAALVFAGLFVAFGMWHTATANSFERVSEAEADRTDAVLAQQNTELAIVTTSYDGGADELTIDVENTGATGLRLSRTDLVVDGTYVTGWRDGATVDGDGGTDLWLGGETLTVVLDRTSQPSRVKVITERGVADASGVS